MRYYSLAAGLAALLLVTVTINDIGVTTDEPHYYDSCRQQIAWFKEALADFTAGQWSVPFEPAVLDRYWSFELLYNVHPPFYKLCSSLTLVLFERWLGPMGAYRLAPAILFSILIGLLFLTVGGRYGVWAGFWAAASFFLMPRIFGHAHIGATDMPLTVLWFASAVSFHRALESRPWALGFAVIYGLALATKFTALVIPLPLAVYILLSGRFRQAAWPVGLTLVVSPLVMVGLNPQWWQHTLERLSLYVANSATRSEYLQIPTYYLGKTYSFYLPWHHCLFYTLITVPPVVLSAFIYGFWRTARNPLSDRWATHMLLHWLALVLVMLLPSSPGHDGVRLFLPAFAFLAVISAKGFYHFSQESLPRILSLTGLDSPAARNWAPALVLLAAMLPSSIVLARQHPYELEYYNSLAGGMRGAAKLGMETTYWWDAINSEGYAVINNALPDSAAVFTLNNWQYRYLQRLGKVRPDLVFRKSKFSHILLDCRQGLFNEEHWLLYKRGRPLAELKKSGVKLFIIYEFPKAYQQILADLKKENSSQSFLDIATAFQVLGMPDSSIIYLRAYVERHPREFKSAMLLVEKLLEARLEEEALACLDRFAKNPDDPLQWYFSLGVAYYHLGRTEQAVTAFERALAQKNLDFTTRANLGHIYYQMGKLDDAAHQYELVLRTRPNYSDALMMLGLINQKQGNGRQAEYYYQKLLEVDPGNSAALVNLGMLAHNGEKVEQSEKYYLQALAADSLSVAANFNLANICLETGREEEAERLYRSVLALQP